jgi:hypothetical protein
MFAFQVSQMESRKIPVPSQTCLISHCALALLHYNDGWHVAS